MEFGIDLGGKYSYHCFVKSVISKVSMFYETQFCFSE